MFVLGIETVGRRAGVALAGARDYTGALERIKPAGPGTGGSAARAGSGFLERSFKLLIERAAGEELERAPVLRPVQVDVEDAAGCVRAAPGEQARGIFALVDSKSSRLMPGLRGIPAVMTTTSLFAVGP